MLARGLVVVVAVAVACAAAEKEAQQRSWKTVRRIEIYRTHTREAVGQVRDLVGRRESSSWH